MKDRFFDRINYSGDIKQVLFDVGMYFELGDFKEYEIIEIGYDDLNLIVKYDKKYLIKIFSDFRTDNECGRYVNIMNEAIKNNVSHPRLIKNKDQIFWSKKYDEGSIRLCVMEYIEGETLFESGYKLGDKDIIWLVKQIDNINLMKPDVKDSVYDSWAIINFVEEYEKNNIYLDDSVKKFVDKVLDEFKSINLKDLPIRFVHGDIISTNIIREDNGNMYILDFSVSGYYPRIQELAEVMLHLLLDVSDISSSRHNIKFFLESYINIVGELSIVEKYALPIFTKAGCAVNILGAFYQKIGRKNDSKENDYFVDKGKNSMMILDNVFKDLYF